MFDFSGIDDHHRRLNAEYERLLADPCLIAANEGDTVLVHAGLLGIGHNWIRLEATVLRVGETSYKVRIEDRGEYWAARPLVTEVVGKKAE